MKHLNIRIQGKVQGVFFRASTREKAQALHISGFVKNCEDGSVYVEAEGKEQDLEQFLVWCHNGPEAAMVTAVDQSEGPLEDFSGFTIRRF